MTDTDAATLAERVREGELRLYELEEHADAGTAAAARRHLLREEVGADLETVGEPEYGTASPYEIPVTLTRTGAESFTTTLVENGFTTTGVTNCEWKGSPDDPGYCLLTVVDGNVTAWHALGPALADSIESGEFEEDPRFVFSAQNETRAERIAATLADEADTADGSEHDDGTDTVTAGDAPTDTTANRSDGGSTPGFTVGAALLALVAAMAVRLGRA